MMMLKSSLFICIFFLAACSASHDTKTFVPQNAMDDNAIVYLYRPAAMSNAIYSPDLFVNKEYKLPIKNGHKTIMILAPGQTLFEIDPDKNYSGQTELLLILEAGNSYFIRVGTSLKIQNTTSYEPYQRSFDLKSIDEKTAISQIEQCCLSNKANAKNDASSIEQKSSSDDGFSVDKTQNPFSH
jgi:hypothetical protein